jgi:hypothetical protein
MVSPHDLLAPLDTFRPPAIPATGAADTAQMLKLLGYDSLNAWWTPPSRPTSAAVP